MRNELLVESNTNALRRAYPQYADMLSIIPQATGYTYEPAGEAVACQDPEGRWIHGPDDPWVAARREAASLIVDEPRMYIVLRPGLGYMALAILEVIESRGLESVVLVVEDRVDLWKASLAFTNWGPAFHCPSAVLLLGNLDDVVDGFFGRHPRLAMLPVTLVAGADCTDVDCERLTAGLETLSHRVKTAVERNFRAADALIHGRRARRQPVRVALAGDHGYLSVPFSRGFHACGCDVEVVPPDAQAPRSVRAQEAPLKVIGATPDLVLWMNRPELSALGSAAFRLLGIANVVWSVDSPRRAQLLGRELATVDLHLYYDAHELPVYAPMGARRSEQLSLAAGIEPLPECSPSVERWPVRLGPDVSFVGTFGDARVAGLRDLMARARPEDLQFLEELAREPGDVAPIFERETGKPYAGSPTLYVDEIRTIRRRTAFLEAVPARLLTIYGGHDWLRAPSNLAERYTGSVPYGTDLASVYYHSLININIFHSQCVDSTNSRVYDVLAAGGFLLTEDNGAIRREFEDGRHLVTFSSPAELADKIRHYLDHPLEREAIAREGQRHVLAKHTFRQRCATLLELAAPFLRCAAPDLNGGTSLL